MLYDYDAFYLIVLTMLESYKKNQRFITISILT